MLNSHGFSQVAFRLAAQHAGSAGTALVCVLGDGRAHVPVMRFLSLAFYAPIQYDSVPESVQSNWRGRCPAK